MSMHIKGTYRAGLIHPDEPLTLPDDTKVEIVVVSTDAARTEVESGPTKRLTSEELEDRIRRFGVSVGNLPSDFSREDIYLDHD